MYHMFQSHLTAVIFSSESCSIKFLNISHSIVEDFSCVVFSLTQESIKK
jgi:hypothetical protein